MTRRYFIECPLEAALAAKNHGFRFVSDMGANLIYDGKWRTEDCLHGEYGGETFYFNPDSLPLLEFRVGDVVVLNPYPHQNDYNRYAEVSDLTNDKKGVVWPGLFDLGYKNPDAVKIIQRNGKPFPEVQWEDVE